VNKFVIRLLQDTSTSVQQLWAEFSVNPVPLHMVFLQTRLFAKNRLGTRLIIGPFAVKWQRKQTLLSVHSAHFLLVMNVECK